MLLNCLSIRSAGSLPSVRPHRTTVMPWFSLSWISEVLSERCVYRCVQRDCLSLFGWNTDYKYRILGSLYEQDGEIAYIFDVKDSEAYFKNYVLPTQGTTVDGKPVVQPLMPSGKRIRAIPESWTKHFRQGVLYSRKDSCRTGTAKRGGLDAPFGRSDCGF